MVLQFHIRKMGIIVLTARGGFRVTVIHLEHQDRAQAWPCRVTAWRLSYLEAVLRKCGWDGSTHTPEVW